MQPSKKKPLGWPEKKQTGFRQKKHYFTLPRIIHMDSMEWRVDSIEWLMDSMDWLMDSILFKSDLMPPQNSIQNSYVNIALVLIIFT